MTVSSLTFDSLLDDLGGFGKYQIYTTILLCIPASFLSAWTYFDLVFMLYSPEKTCQQWNVNYSLIQENFGNKTDECDYENQKIINDFNNIEIHCENWTTDHRYFDQTLKTQWGLCRHDFLATNVMTIFVIIGIIGLTIMSAIQDIIGRKLSFLICLTLTLIGSGFSLLAPTLGIWVAVRSIQMTQSTSAYNLPFVWAQEFVGPEKRTFVNFLITLFYSTATVSLGVIAYACRTWIQLGLCTVVPFILLYSYIYLVDESPRWLLSVGKLDRATKVVEKIARINGKPEKIPRIKHQLKLISDASLIEHNKHDNDKNDPMRFQPLELFRTHNLRMKTILLTVAFIANSIVYSTVAFNAPNLGNMYIAYIAQASVEAPACVFNLLLSNRIGRMPPLILSMFFSAFFSFLCLPAYIHDWNEWYVIIFAALAKFGICISYNILCQAAGELYPTSLRATGFGVNCFVADICVGAMPYILDTASTHKWLPMFILGVITLIGAICSCFLPETMNQAMPQTALEAEEVSKVGVSAIKDHIKNLFKGFAKK